MLEQNRNLTFILLLLLTTFACGREEEQEPIDVEESPRIEATLIATDPISVGPETPCSSKTGNVSLPESKPQELCRTLANGSIYRVTLKASTVIQDPETCAITYSDDGLRASMVEMGFTTCDSES